MTNPITADWLTSTHVHAAAAAIRGRWDGQPEAALVLGTGLQRLSSLVQAEAVIPYADIPHFPRSTAVGHRGRLVCGRIGERSVMVMAGRCHGYEGYLPTELALPVLAMRALGVQRLILSNASGGLNPRFASGDVVVVADHINLLFWKPTQPDWASSAIATDRRRYVPMYDASLVEQALEIARRESFTAHRGVYVAMTGPNYETRAEYRFLRRIGGDVVGMSTVPEALAAAACGLRTLALSIVTNVARPDCPQVVLAADVIRAAERAETHVGKIMTGVVAEPWAGPLDRGGRIREFDRQTGTNPRSHDSSES
jgi:purine-nucleoside phosphorylase